MFEARVALFAARVRVLLNETLSRSYYKKDFSYEEIYRGKFEYHDRSRYPKSLAPIKEEELLDEIHAIRAKNVDQPSPFHVVRRVRSMGGIPWHQKVTLRRLNLHSSSNGDCAIVPNTPQYNCLISKVKHLIQLKPATFPDGRIPTEKDIGAIKVCPYTGEITIDEKLRLKEKRLNLEPPVLFQGNHLRLKLNIIHGLKNKHFIKA